MLPIANPILPAVVLRMNFRLLTDLPIIFWNELRDNQQVIEQEMF
jgi:hypothetical protein